MKINKNLELLLNQATKVSKKFIVIRQLPKKKTKRKPLTAQDKSMNKKISSLRVLNENIIAHIKKFKIISDKYRNQRKRLYLRFNLIHSIYNLEIGYARL